MPPHGPLQATNPSFARASLNPSPDIGAGHWALDIDGHEAAQPRRHPTLYAVRVKGIRCHNSTLDGSHKPT